MNSSNDCESAEGFEILVTVLDSHAGALAAVAGELAAAGMTRLQLQPALGAVTGRAPASLLERLRSLDGVDAVEISRRVGIP